MSIFDEQSVADSLIQTLTIITLVAGIVFGIVRWAIRSIEHKISESTRQINPNANGGKSLADLHKKVDGLGEQIDARFRGIEAELAIHTYRLTHLEATNDND